MFKAGGALTLPPEMQEAKLPLGAVWVQDWSGRQDFGLGNRCPHRWVLDEDFTASMIANLVDERHTFPCYANPFIVEALDDHFPAMRDQGLLVQNERMARLTTTPNGPSGLPDQPTRRREITWISPQMVQTLGMDGWMLDFGEWLPHDVTLSDGSSGAAAQPIPEQWHRLSREVTDEARDGTSALQPLWMDR